MSSLESTLFGHLPPVSKRAALSVRSSLRLVRSRAILSRFIHRRAYSWKRQPHEPGLSITYDGRSRTRGCFVLWSKYPVSCSSPKPLDT